MKFTTRLYTAYAIFIFILTCIVIIPLLVLLCQRKSWHPTALKLHNVWSWTFYILTFIPVKIERRFEPKDHKQYIYCANHFSYIDIPSILLATTPKFIGKSSLGKIPIFGYFYRKIHITVNRSSMRSRAESIQKAGDAMDAGYNVAFFPEGGVRVKAHDLPTMVPFRDGAFRLSVKKQLPIVPVTLLDDFILFPDKKPLRLNRHACRIVMHEPIFPQEQTDSEVKRLKELTYQTIQNELNKHHKQKVEAVR